MKPKKAVVLIYGDEEFEYAECLVGELVEKFNVFRKSKALSLSEE